MILSPGEQRSLRHISGSIAEGEPHLAGMFRIFARLHADDAAPPVEDLIVAIPRARADGAANEQPGGRSRLRRWLRLPSQGAASRPLPESSPEAAWRLEPERPEPERRPAAGWQPEANQLPGMMRARPLRGAPRARRPRQDWVRRRSTLRVGQVLAAFAVPVVLLATLLMVILFGLNSSIRCQSGRTATTTGSTSASGTTRGTGPVKGSGTTARAGTKARTGTTARTGTGAAARTGTGAAAGASARTGARSAGGADTAGSASTVGNASTVGSASTAGSGRPSAAGPAPDRLTRPGGSIGLLPTGCLRSGTPKSGGH